MILLAACGSSTPSNAQLNGIYGGYLYLSGNPFLVFAMNASTSSSGQLSGYGALTDGSSEVSLSVSGSTGPNSANVRLTDSVGDTIIVTATLSGQIYSGNWSTSFSSDRGTVRFTHENNIENLSVPSLQGDSEAGGTLADLF